jgi:Protein of unknown function (DUF2726)
MSPLVLIIFLVFCIALALLFLKFKQQDSKSVGFPYQPIKYIFSPAERSFLGVLDQAVGPDYRVFGKVRVADLASVKPGLSRSARQGALNRIAFKHFDYIICKASDLSVVCAVELNDKSHASKSVQARDALIIKVCEVINLKLITFPAKQSYSVEEVRASLKLLDNAG